MARTYTEDDLEELREYVQDRVDELGLSIAARESVFQSFENLLKGPNQNVTEFSREQVDRCIQTAKITEDWGGIYDEVATENTVYVDMSDERGHRGPTNNRENFTDWDDEKALECLSESYERLLGIGEERAEHLAYWLD